MAAFTRGVDIRSNNVVYDTVRIHNDDGRRRLNPTPGIGSAAETIAPTATPREIRGSSWRAKTTSFRS